MVTFLNEGDSERSLQGCEAVRASIPGCRRVCVHRASFEGLAGSRARAHSLTKLEPARLASLRLASPCRMMADFRTVAPLAGKEGIG